MSIREVYPDRNNIRIVYTLDISTFGLVLELEMWRSQWSFWPLTASVTIEFKNNYAYVTTQRNLNKFIEINFSVGCIVWP